MDNRGIFLDSESSVKFYQWFVPAFKNKKDKLPNENVKDIQKILKQKKNFSQSAKAKSKNPYDMYNGPAYHELVYLLELGQFHIRDFLNAADIPYPQFIPENADLKDTKYTDKLTFLPFEICNIYRKCDEMPDEKREKVLFLAKNMSPRFWQSPIDDAFAIVNKEDLSDYDEDSKTPHLFHSQEYNIMQTLTKKVYLIARRKGIKKPEINSNDTIRAVNPWVTDSLSEAVCAELLVGKNIDTIIPFTKAPYFAAGLNVSLHELFCMPDNIFLYAKEKYTETIVTAYYFMSDQNKKIFYDVLMALPTTNN